MKKRLIGILLTLTMLLSLLPVAAFAATTVESGTCGANLTWTLDSDGVLTISGTGDMADWDEDTNTPWYDYSDQIQSVEIEDGVTSIGDRAFFYYCTSLTSVTIGNSVMSIGDGAFYWCENLASVTIPGSVTSIGDLAFFNCTSLTSVTIPNSVTSIGYLTFGGCESLTSVTIPDSITSIGNATFSGCDSLTGVTIPDGVTSIGYQAFGYCDSLTSVTIPASVVNIDEGAFESCTSLTAITVSGENEYYKDIDGVLFSVDGTLLHTYPLGKTATSYTIPDGVTSIGEYAFAYSDNLTSVSVPASVTYIGSIAFNYSTSLTDFYFGGSLEDWGAAMGDNELALSATVTFHFNSTPYTITWLDEDDTVLATTLVEAGDTPSYDAPAKSGYSFLRWNPTPVPAEADATYTAIYHINSASGGGGTATIAEGYCGDPNVNDGKDVTWTLSDGVLTISGTGAMEEWSYSENVPWARYRTDILSASISDGITSIASMAFYCCNNMANVAIPSSVTSIGISAFYSCSRLSDVIIPDGVISIGKWAFEQCDGLSSVVIPDSVLNIGAGSFAGCNSLTAFSVSNGNQRYTTADGVLFSSDRKTIHTYPSGNTATSYRIPDGVMSIGEEAFGYCDNLTSVMIPNSVTSIERLGFAYCSNLTSVTIPNSVTSVGEAAFNSCASLKSVTIPNSAQSIGDYAFSWCDNLTSVTIPNSVKSIGEKSFSGTDVLTDIYFSGTEADWNAAVGDNDLGLNDTVTIHYNSIGGGSGGGSMATSGGTQVVGSDGTNASVSGTVISADPDAGTVNISGVELTYANGFNGVKLGKQVEGKSVDIDLDRSGRIATYEISVYGTITAYITNESVSIDGKKYTYSDSLAEEDRIAAWVNEHCNLYLDGSGEVIGWWLSRSGSGLRGITMVSDTGYVEDGVKYTYASSFVGDKLTWQVLGCDVGSWSRDNSGAITRIYYVTYYGTVKAADTNGVTIRRNSEDERTFPYTSSFAGSKLGASDVDSYMHLKLNAKGEITDYYYDVDGELVSADSSGITLVLDGGETATYQYPSGYSRTKLTNDAAQAARYVNIYLNSNRQIDHVSLSGAYGYIIAADPTVGTVSILESGSSGEVRTYTCDSNFNGAPVSTAFIGCRISTSLNINGKLSWYHIYADDKNDFRSQTLPNAVKFVPYSVNLLDVIKSVYPEGDCTYQVTSGLPAWLTVNKDTSELSGIPTETGSCGFQMKVTVGTVNETWVFTLDVKDNTTAAVTQEVAPELKIEQTVSNMTTTNLTDQVFEIEDKVEDENESNFDKFMEVYLDGVLLVGGKIGENETVKTVEDVPDEWEYYAEEGSTKITVRAQTFEKKAAAGTHTIAATFSKTDPETGEQTTMTAAQNFTISTPGGGGSSSSSKTTKNETKDNGTIKYTVKDGVAQLDAKSMDKLTESAKENSVLTLDFTTAGQTVTTAKLPAGMIDKLAKLLADDTNKAQSLAVKLTSGALTFDAASLAEIAKQAGNAELSLSLTEVAASSLSAQQQEALTAIGAEKVFSVEIKAGDKQVADFGGGRVTLGVPFTVPAGRDARGYAVWHLAENGGTNRHSTAYAGGSLSFRTAHFSYYAVAYQEAKSFNDIPNGLWFASDVNHMVSLGLMSGVGGSSFAPDMELNRAMVAQILYNLEKAEAGASAKFEDVPETAWYADAVNWAAEAGVVEGVGDGRFEPMRAVTRGELVAMLYKYAAYKQYSVSNVAALDRFPDSNTLPDWTKGAMQWAVGTKLISGINGKLADQETATRAQAAKVLTYFMEMYEA